MAADRRYHHRDLPRAAVAAALELLSEPGGALSLPAVGRKLGVSHAALYRHFAGRRGLLAAVAVEGYAAFAALLTERTGQLNGTPLLEAACRAYLEFASDQPGYFRALFHRELRDRADLPELEEVSKGNLNALSEILRRAGFAHGPEAAALAWSAMHGLSKLRADGWLPGGTGLSEVQTEALPELLAAMLLRGLPRRGPPNGPPGR